MSGYWKVTLEAAAWTFAQVFCVTLGASAIGLAPGDLEGWWAAIAAAAFGAAGAAFSLFKSRAVRKLGTDRDSPFLTG